MSRIYPPGQRPSNDPGIAFSLTGAIGAGRLGRTPSRANNGVSSMIHARAIVPNPDDEDRFVSFDRTFRTEDEYDWWLHYSPEGMAAHVVITDSKPMPPDWVS